MAGLFLLGGGAFVLRRPAAVGKKPGGGPEAARATLPHQVACIGVFLLLAGLIIPFGFIPPTVLATGALARLFGGRWLPGLAVGLVTPPVGMCLNVASAISRLGIGTIFRAALPFLVANIITLILLSIFPQLSIWLPSILMK